jgi:hypothetical protein
MGLKLFLDDLRNPPDDTWTLFRPQDIPAFIHMARHVNAQNGDILSLDHDLGDGFITGYKVMCILENSVRCEGTWWSTGIPEIIVHSANPVGKASMLQVIEAIKKFLDSVKS